MVRPKHKVPPLRNYIMQISKRVQENIKDQRVSIDMTQSSLAVGSEYYMNTTY